MSLKHIFINTLARAGAAAVDGVERDPTAFAPKGAGKRRTKKKKKGADCSPCAAMARRAAASQRVAGLKNG